VYNWCVGMALCVCVCVCAPAGPGMNWGSSSLALTSVVQVYLLVMQVLCKQI